MSKASIAALLLAGSLSGCASLTGAKVDLLRVDSSPPDAAVSVNGQGGGRTPAIVEVDKKAPPSVEVSMKGYPPAWCSTRMSPAARYIVADVVLCAVLFPLGCISFIDAGGAWNELDQPRCLVVFGDPPSASPGPPAGPPPPPGAPPPPPPNRP